MQPERPNTLDLMKRRDLDLDLLGRITFVVDRLPQSANLIVTGSYAIEALTDAAVYHGDIDTNIFTENMSEALPQIASSLVRRSDMVLCKRIGNRLEYDVSYGNISSTRLEIQFVEFVRKVERGNLEEFILDDGQGDYSTVPVTQVTMLDSAGNELLFRVKSLPYAIATWVIRVSGVAKDPKRQVAERDWVHLRLLMANYSEEEKILAAISCHPQMPKGVLGAEILKRITEEF